jgi:hypothetical protein
MTNKNLVELLKYCSPDIIYVVSGRNQIVKLKTPIELLVNENIDNFYKGQIVFCTELKITEKANLVFYIQGKHYHTHHFDILIK